MRIGIRTQLLPEVRAEFAAAFECAEGDEVDALVVSLEHPLDAARVAALPERTRAVATYSVGTDHLDLDALHRRGIAVFNTPGVLAEAVAETALLLLLGAARRATESAALLRSGRWQGWTPVQLVGVQLSGRTLGILGMGDIGRRIAARARAFGMEIAYCNRRPLPDDEAQGARYAASAEELVASVDALVLACPSTTETRGSVDAALLAAAKPGLLLVNIARGDLVVDDDLIAALESGAVRAAGLDVFAGEPDIDPRYLELPNVFAMPHIGSSTIEARLGMGRILIEALQAWARGERPGNQL